MKTSLINAFTQGDLNDLKSKLLHSTYWSQHGTKSYGEDQLKAVPINWLTLVGKSNVVNSITIANDEHLIVALCLQPKQSEQLINYTFWLHTNGKVIKSVDAIVDTLHVAKATNQKVKDIKKHLPKPDALVIQEYDQQDHLQNELATPSNVTTLAPEISELLDTWWTIWSKAQLAAIDIVYHEDANIQLPGEQESALPNDLFNFVLSKLSKLTRTFAQLESVVIEDNKVAIKWYLDGDENNQKVRIPFISILTLNENKFSAETLTVDILAFEKQFTKSQLFSS